jgi:F0F1-type ATP synthase membrane subunit c/vacuolar-type H+-ATPase subunit K
MRIPRPGAVRRRTAATAQGCQRAGAAYVWRMRLILPASAFALLLAAGPAAAQQNMTAAALGAMCAARAQQPVCASYIQGYVDGRNQSLPKATVCLPSGTSVGDVAGKFVEHIGKNRLEGNLQAGLVLGNVLITNYPCR